MKTKFFSVLFVFALFAAACAPVVAGNETPKDPAPAAVNQNAAIVPITGASVSVPDRVEQAPRLWSGEISNSDSNGPDQGETLQAPANTAASTERTCTSEDDVEQKYSGCLE